LALFLLRIEHPYFDALLKIASAYGSPKSDRNHVPTPNLLVQKYRLPLGINPAYNTSHTRASSAYTIFDLSPSMADPSSQGTQDTWLVLCR